MMERASLVGERCYAVRRAGSDHDERAVTGHFGESVSGAVACLHSSRVDHVGLEAQRFPIAVPEICAEPQLVLMRCRQCLVGDRCEMTHPNVERRVDVREVAGDLLAVCVVVAGQRRVDRDADGSQARGLRVLHEFDRAAVPVHVRDEFDDDPTLPSGESVDMGAAGDRENRVGTRWWDERGCEHDGLCVGRQPR